ncbi:MAG: pitrilysin family protein [Methylococcales bacterium]|nr:pitrilysin family protein [Methylococcales bacterium]
MSKLKWMVVLLLTTLLTSIGTQAAPVFTTWQTRQGTPVYYLEADSLPMVDVKVTFAAGSARDGKHPGVAALTVNLLDSGAGDEDADAIARRLENIGAQLVQTINRDFASLSLRTLSREDSLQSALETLTLLLREPTFAEADFKREQARTLASLKYQQALPGNIVNRAFYQTLYPSHPYAHEPEGDITSVQALTVADVKDFYRRHYVAGNAMIVIVGALPRTQAEAVAQQLADALPEGSAVAALPALAPAEQGVTRHIEFASTQTHIMAGLPGIGRTDPDYYALYLGNHILGGRALVSRLFEEVREKRGLAYSASSYFMPLAQPGPFVISLQTRNSEAERALDVARNTLAEFIEQGPTADELASAKKNITGGFVMRFDSNAELAGYAELIGFYGLPLDYLVTFTEAIAQQSVASVRAAFARHVQLDRLNTLTVGQRQPDAQ